MPKLTKVESIMAKGIFTVSLDDSVQMADKIMTEEKIRHIPVTDDGKFIGIITETTLVEYRCRNLYEPRVSDSDDSFMRIGDFKGLVKKSFKFIYPEDSVLKAVEVMSKNKMDCLPIVDWDKNLIGLLTIHDLLLFLHKKLEEEMTKNE
jgi:CBS domain-containing protein